MDASFQPAEQTPEGFPVVSLHGEIDLAQAPALRARVGELLGAGHSTIVVDMLGVSFLDSTALGVLVEALGRCREAGGELHLVATAPRILKVLEITGLASTFPLHTTRRGVTSTGQGGE